MGAVWGPNPREGVADRKPPGQGNKYTTTKHKLSSVLINIFKLIS